MTRLKLLASTSIALGTSLAFSSWRTGLALGILVLVWRTGTTITKSIFILDHTTGQMTAQAQDTASDRYLRDKDKDNS